MARGRGRGRGGQGRNHFSGYAGGGYSGGGDGYYGRGRGRGRGYQSHQYPQSDQNAAIQYLWNANTGHEGATVTCMAYDAGSLYVGLDNGVVKIYTYNPDVGVGGSRNARERFKPSSPPEVSLSENGQPCPVKSIVVHHGQVYVAVVKDTTGEGLSEIFCPNTQQRLGIPGKVEHMVLCTRANSPNPSLWAGTLKASMAVVDLLQPAPGGPFQMQAKAELNLDRAFHAGSITQVCEVLCTAVHPPQSVLISGDTQGVLGVWDINSGAPLQQIPRPAALGPADMSRAAISAIVEYQGTNFITASLDGLVSIWAFANQPQGNQVVAVNPVAQYAPQVAAPSGFHSGGSAVHAAVRTIAVASQPLSGPQGTEQLLDWLIVSRLGSDALETVKLDPNFEWGGGLNQSTDCRCILPVAVSLGHAEEHFVLVGSKHIMKIFKWKM